MFSTSGLIFVKLHLCHYFSPCFSTNQLLLGEDIISICTNGRSLKPAVLLKFSLAIQGNMAVQQSSHSAPAYAMPGAMAYQQQQSFSRGQQPPPGMYAPSGMHTPPGMYSQGPQGNGVQSPSRIPQFRTPSRDEPQQLHQPQQQRVPSAGFAEPGGGQARTPSTSGSSRALVRGSLYNSLYSRTVYGIQDSRNVRCRILVLRAFY